jgi:hypothetical protein
VVSSKQKTRRNPWQRLSDQRRSLALAGLAVGAVFSAAILRRKRRGGETEFGQPEAAPTAPPAATGSRTSTSTTTAPASPDVAATATAATASQADPEAPETAGAPVAEPEPTDDAPVNAEEPATAEEAPATTLSEPTTGELSAEEASILSVLAQHGRTDDDRTVIAVATSLERETTDVAEVLRKLNAEGVVAGELYTATGDKIWAVTERGVRRLGAQH